MSAIVYPTGSRLAWCGRCRRKRPEPGVRLCTTCRRYMKRYNRGRKQQSAGTWRMWRVVPDRQGCGHLYRPRMRSGGGKGVADAR